MSLNNSELYCKMFRNIIIHVAYRNVIIQIMIEHVISNTFGVGGQHITCLIVIGHVDVPSVNEY